MPETTEALSRRTVNAEVALSQSVTYAVGEIWTGAWRDLVEASSERTVGAPGDSVDLDLSVRDLGGRRHDGRVNLRVFGTDGNHPLGAARWTRARPSHVSSQGARPSVTLAGEGPWWIEAAPVASLRASSASIVVWDRVRPASLRAAERSR